MCPLISTEIIRNVHVFNRQKNLVPAKKRFSSQLPLLELFGVIVELQ